MIALVLANKWKGSLPEPISPMLHLPEEPLVQSTAATSRTEKKPLWIHSEILHLSYCCWQKNRDILETKRNCYRPFPADILTCHNWKSTGVNNIINDSWSQFLGPGIAHTSLLSLWLTINVISSTYNFPTMTSPHSHYENKDTSNW